MSHLIHLSWQIINQCMSKTSCNWLRPIQLPVAWNLGKKTGLDFKTLFWIDHQFFYMGSNVMGSVFPEVFEKEVLHPVVMLTATVVCTIFCVYSSTNLQELDQSCTASAKHFVLDSSGQSHTDPQSPQLSPFWTGLSRHTFSVGSCPALASIVLIAVSYYLSLPDYLNQP